MDIETKLTVSLILLIMACVISGCANTRFYWGMDYYGETDSHETAWRTGNADLVKRK